MNRAGSIQRTANALRVGGKLATNAVRVLRDEPSMLVYPAAAGVATLAYALGVGLVFVEAELATSRANLVATGFALYFGSTLLASIGNVGLVYASHELFHGRDPTLRAGFREGLRHIGSLVFFAAVAATVGMVLRRLDGENGLTALVLDVTWGALTFFVVPVLVFEDAGPIEMFRRSGKIVTDTWGKAFSVSLGVWFVSFLVVPIGIGLGLVWSLLVGGGTPGLFVGGAIIVLSVLAYLLVGSALRSIAEAGLYVYAAEGESPEYFENVYLIDFRGQR